MFQRICSLILVFALCLPLLVGCGAQAGTETTTAAPTTEATEPVLTGPAALDGKKIIFIGNSYTYHGNCVLSKPDGLVTQNERIFDQGYFYQLCKLNGAECLVTNWTFGGHNLSQTFGGGACGKSGDCEAIDHQSMLIDPDYDYVAMQPYVESMYTGNLNLYLKNIVSFFRKANPDVKFLLLVPHMAYDHGYKWVDGIEGLNREDFIVCNWGGMLHDIVQGNVEVPGATQEYLRSSFVVSINEKDGHHQNLLAGYLTTLMVYCAITGDSAVGQPYDFCNDSSINAKFDFLNFRENKYVYDPTTNFVEIYESEADMAGLQQLVDQYIAKYNEVN